MRSEEDRGQTPLGNSTIYTMDKEEELTIEKQKNRKCCITKAKGTENFKA